MLAVPFSRNGTGHSEITPRKIKYACACAVFVLRWHSNKRGVALAVLITFKSCTVAEETHHGCGSAIVVSVKTV